MLWLSDVALSFPVMGSNLIRYWQKYAEPDLQFILQLPFPDKHSPSPTSKIKIVFTCPVLKSVPPPPTKCSLRMLACNLEKAWISALVSKVFYCSAGPCAWREVLYLADLINRILFIIMGI